MKYIIIEAEYGMNSNGSTERKVAFPIIFPNCLVHSEVFNGITRTFRRHGFLCAKAVAAGFYNVINGCCDGKSETLNLDSRGREDERIIIACEAGKL